MKKHILILQNLLLSSYGVFWDVAKWVPTSKKTD